MTLLLHPGFHKTATSWLQSTVFAEQRLFRPLMDHGEIDELLVRPHDFDFDADAAKARVAALRQAAKPGITDVISSEILSGNIILGSRDSAVLADRLAAVCGPAKVLQTVRAQRPIMKSIYFQYIKRGGRLGIEDYLDFKPEPGYFWVDPVTLEFDRLAQAYAAHFGAENVMVLPQELLAKDRAQYLRLLCQHAGLDESEAERELGGVSARGVSPPASGVWLLRKSGSIRQGPLNPRAPGWQDAAGTMIERVAYRWTWGKERADQRLKQALNAKLTARYGASNKRLQQFTPVDLASLGYEIDA